MENFDWTQFTRKIAIDAPIQTLYDAWAIPGELEKWFLSTAGLRDKDGLDPGKRTSAEKGFAYAWQWYTYDATENGKIVEANGTDHFAFTFAGDCLVTVKLTAYKDQTLVTLTQSGIPTDEKSKRDIRLGCHTGWSFFMVNLKSVYEGGHDLRNKDNDLQGVVNS
jgi:uncharacterized protein YndB with AHSA1/START domain